MILIDEIRITDLPSNLQEKPASQVNRSLFLWKMLYVSGNEAKNHTTLGYFGLVPVDYLSRVGYLWLAPQTKTPSRKMMQEAKIAFTSFSNLLPWTTYVYTELNNKRNRRFAEFMGYIHEIDADGYHFFSRDKK
jgi:hypothetical protein